jgi:hypothetical protein
MHLRALSDELAQEAVDLVGQHGGVTQAARACGMSYDALRRRNDVGKTRGFTPKVVKDIPQSETGHGVLVIPDTHAPFAHPDALAFLDAANTKLKPTRVVHLGDETDQHALSQYEADPDGYSAGVELQKAVEWMRELYKIFPKARVCISNHPMRVFKRAFRSGIPAAYLKGYKEVMEAPSDWYWGDRWEIDGVVYMHGEGASGKLAAEKWAMVNMQSTVIGHIHSHAATGNFKNESNKQIHWMNAGWLGNYEAYAMRYAKHSTHKGILGVGFVDNGIPHYFPMRINEKGRWTGKW